MVFCTKLIIFLPLLSFLLLIFGCNMDRIKVQIVSCSLIALTFINSCILFFNQLGKKNFQFLLFDFIKIADINISWAIEINSLSLVMIFVVTFISLIVHIYSIGYMKNERYLARYMSLLGFFTFAMLLLVVSENMVQLFVGWEAVGVCSYLLIGFWYDRIQPPKAALKAFLVNRVGDVGLILAMIIIFVNLETFEFCEINKKIINFKQYNIDVHLINLIGIFLLIAAAGKSAQFGLHVWLPDAMTGPTPVSALIHAATMVTAGIFLIARFSFLFEVAEFARNIMLYLGCLTALFAASVALVQNDIKKIIAYSTCSQLGFMVIACGCSAYKVAIFHLFTHAFFKALLFLGAGSVIHAMSDEQNIKKMGNIWKNIPITYIMLWIGSLALAGIPFFAGYYSKELILESAYRLEGAKSLIVYGIGILTTFLTALYSWRLIFTVFHGSSKVDERVFAHIHESPKVMIYPMVILSIMSVFSGYIGEKLLIENSLGFGWSNIVFVKNVTISHANFIIGILPVLLGMIGVLMAYKMYFKDSNLSSKITKLFGKIHKFLVNGWLIDNFFKIIFVDPIVKISRFLSNFLEQKFIERFWFDFSQKLSFNASSFLSSRLQTGYLYDYITLMLVGIFVCLLSYSIYLINLMVKI